MSIEDIVPPFFRKQKEIEVDLSRFPMRVAIICPYSISMPGGVQNQVILQMNFLRKRGIDARIIAPCDGAAPNQYVIPVGTTRAVKGNGSLAPIADDREVSSMTLGAIENFIPDVLHLHEPLIPGPTTAAMIGADVAMVATLHAAGEGAQAMKYFRHPARGAISRVQQRVCVSESAKVLATKFLPGQYSVVPNAIDLAAYKNIEPWPKVKPAVLFVGRHEERKGLRFLIDAWLSSKISQDNYDLWVAGTGEETQELIQKSAHCSSIHFVGRINDMELKRRMTAADILVAPATGGESFGIILLEAMATKCAIIASDIPGYREVARGSKESLLVEHSNVGELKNALENLTQNKEKRDVLTHNSTIRVREFAIEKVVEQYVDVYRTAMEQHKAMV